MTHRPARAVIATALALVCAALPNQAAAEGKAKNALQATPSFDALPVAEGEIPMGDPPLAIPKEERAQGLYMEAPRYYGDSTPPYLSVFTSQQDAEEYFESGRAEGCFDQGYYLHMSESEQIVPSLAPTTTISTQVEELDETERVQPVRSENLVQRPDGSAEIVIKRFWLDPRSQGSQLVDEQRIALARIGTAPGKLAIYAYRTDGFVHFVLQRPHQSDRDDFLAGVMMTGEFGMSSNSQLPCHSRVGVRAEAGSGGLASAELDIIVDDDDEVTVPPMFRGSQAFRIQTMLFSFSASWLSSDDQPVLDVSHAFFGKPRTEFF